MFLAQLFEAVDKRHASFCFGRMNPPTVGHAQVINTVANSAQGGDYFVFTSQTQDSKKNPLDYATKVKFLKAMFPEQANHIVQDPSIKTIIQVAHWLYNKGYRSVTMVAGSDRLSDFKELLEKYNGVQGPNGYYQFDSINFVSSGDRDPDGEGLAGVSATAAREAAKAGNLEAFAQATGAGDLAEPLFHAVRKGMLVEGLRDPKDNPCWKGYKPVGTKKKAGKTVPNCVPVEEHIVKHGSGYRLVSKKTGKNLGDFPSKAAAKKHEREVEYFKHMKESTDAVEKLTHEIEQLKKMISNPRGRGVASMRKHLDQLYKDLEKARNVSECSGYIPKNKKEAKDPRWSNALTVDVHPDTPNKNLKAFKLA